MSFAANPLRHTRAALLPISVTRPARQPPAAVQAFQRTEWELAPGCLCCCFKCVRMYPAWWILKPILCAAITTTPAAATTGAAATADAAATATADAADTAAAAATADAADTATAATTAATVDTAATNAAGLPTASTPAAHARVGLGSCHHAAAGFPQLVVTASSSASSIFSHELQYGCSNSLPAVLPT